jgi:hypothetical protein
MLSDMPATDPLGALAEITEDRRKLDLFEQQWVLAAREEGYSWHKIAVALNQTGEGVRNRHGKMET